MPFVEDQPVTKEQVREVNNLGALVAQLNAEIKAKRSIIKELESQLDVADHNLQKKLHACELHYEQRQAELRVSVAPLESLKQKVSVYEGQVNDAKSALQQETANLKHARQVELSAINQDIAKAQDRLAHIVAEIQSCKAKVQDL